MDLSRNILLSTAMHGMLAVAVAVFVGRGAGLRAPSPAVHVALVFETGPATGGHRTDAKIAGTPAPVRTAAPKVRRKTEASSHVAETVPPVVVDEVLHPREEGVGAGEQHAVPSGQEKGIRIITGTEAGAGPSGPAGSAGDGQKAASRTASGPGSSPGGDRSDAVGLIRAAIEKAKSYPAIAKRRGLQGTATVSFTIDGKGYPEHILISRSSGSGVLDDAARATITRAAPFPVISGVIEVPIVYRLEK